MRLSAIGTRSGELLVARAATSGARALTYLCLIPHAQPALGRLTHAADHCCATTLDVAAHRISDVREAREASRWF